METVNTSEPIQLPTEHLEESQPGDAIITKSSAHSEIVNTPESAQLSKDRSEESQPSDVIVISKTTVNYFLIGTLFFVAGFIVAWITFSVTSQSLVDRAQAAAYSAAHDVAGTAVAQIPVGGGVAAVQATETPIPHQDIVVGDSPAWGPANAKVTIVEFSDFQCPFCEVFFKQTYPLIKQNYGDKIRFVYKNFPLTSIHPYAEGAALAAECANEQGKFWDYHDQLFTNQSDLTLPSLVTYAKNAGVPDIDKFSQCLNTQKFASRINDSVQAGSGYYVNGTPTFFINGNILVGAQPYQTFQYYIDQALKDAG